MGTSAFMGTSGHICAAVWMHVCNKTTQGSPTAAQMQEVKQRSMKYISNKQYFLFYKLTPHLLRHIPLNH